MPLGSIAEVAMGDKCIFQSMPSDLFSRVESAPLPPGGHDAARVCHDHLVILPVRAAQGLESVSHSLTTRARMFSPWPTGGRVKAGEIPSGARTLDRSGPGDCGLRPARLRPARLRQTEVAPKLSGRRGKRVQSCPVYLLLRLSQGTKAEI